MKVYISVELQRRVRERFANCCAYCRTAEDLTVAIFEFEHIVPHRWLEHFAWNEEATQIVGLTPTGRATIAALKMNRLQMIRVRQMWVAMNEHPPDLD